MPTGRCPNTSRPPHGCSTRDDARVDPLTGMLLIANSPLFDPNFRRTVVFIGHHDEDGAVGVVLNRTLEVTVREAVPPLGGLVTEDEPCTSAGRCSRIPWSWWPTSWIRAAPRSWRWARSGSCRRRPTRTSSPRSAGRACSPATRAGARGNWRPNSPRTPGWSSRRSPDDVFHPEPGRLWADVLRRKGRDFDMLRLMPDDPAMN